MITPPGSQLRSPLPAFVERALRERGIAPEDVVIATSTDLDLGGAYRENWLVVTRTLVLVFSCDAQPGRPETARPVRELPLERIERVRTDSRVGSGFLEAQTAADRFEELVRFSNSNADKFAKVAAKLKSLTEGKHVEVMPGDEEGLARGRCQVCGARVPDRHMTTCPKCMKRGLVFIRFLTLIREFWPHMAVMMALVVATILLNLVPQQLMRVMLDNVFGDEPILPWFGALIRLFGLETQREWLYLVVGCLAASTAAIMVVGWFRERLAVWVSNRLGFQLRAEVFRKLEDLAVQYHDTHPTGQLMTRCAQDIEMLQNFINQMTGGFGFQLILVVSVAVVMFTASWKLALIACLPAPFVMGCTVLYYRYVVPRWRKFWTTRSNLNNVLYASLSGIRVVKAFAQEDRESERFERYSGRFRDAGLDVGFSQALFMPTMSFVFQLGGYFIWLFGGAAVLTGEMTLGKLMMFLGYLGLFYQPLNSLTQMSTWFTQFTTQAHRVFEVLDQQPEVVEDEACVDIEIQGAVRFENVTFGYDPHIPILQDVSLSVRPGEMVGIVGHSGSGKSTTVNLVMRFYDPQDGRITIDDIPLHRIRKTCLRRQTGLVAQDPFLFGGTVAENIAYGNPDVAPELVLNAALAANAHMFITRIHDGYDTRLGDRGSGLSGGERQRVAIARGLLHNPRILILDEATSSVDTIAEREIQQALESLSLGRTTLVIAHRLSTLRNCDRILVFEEGRIREQGTHEELMAGHGIYHKLVKIQTQLTSDRETAVDSLSALDDLERAEEAKTQQPLTDDEKQESRRRPAPHIHYLDPKQLEVHSLDEGGMRVAYKDRAYDYVRAYRCFPVSRPSEFVALWTGTSALEHQEIGVVRRLKELAPSSRSAVEHELAKRYFIHYIERINVIKEELGFLSWDVDTDKGRKEFLTRRWDRNTVVEGGTNGRVILDVDYNRYEIEDLDVLDSASRAAFLKFIYW